MATATTIKLSTRVNLAVLPLRPSVDWAVALAARPTEAVSQHLIWGTAQGETIASPAARMSVLISYLKEPGDFGFVEWNDPVARTPWCQTMRHPEGWIVEVSPGTPGSLPYRVYRGLPGDAYPGMPGCAAHAAELFKPHEVAALIWTWQHDCLVPAGVRLTHDQLTGGGHADHGI